MNAVLDERHVGGRDVGHLQALVVDERHGQGADLRAGAVFGGAAGAWTASRIASANADIAAS